MIKCSVLLSHCCYILDVIFSGVKCKETNSKSQKFLKFLDIYCVTTSFGILGHIHFVNDGSSFNTLHAIRMGCLK
jgi:hypothetical protein